MKKTKFLLAAMALPMLFTACSQDELVEDYGTQKGPDAEGFYATLNPGLDSDVASRASWVGARLDWDETDKISIYWLGAESAVSTTEPAKYKFNSIFKTEDGSAFTSESMVFVGDNVAVYPANTANYVGDEDIVLSVSDKQDANTIKSIPYISNMLNIKKRTSQTGNNPGYNQGIDAPMKMAANVFNLTFELKNTAALSTYGFAVESVTLQTENKNFAKEAKIVVDERQAYTETGVEDGYVTTPYYESLQDYKNASGAWERNQPTISKNLWVEAVTDTKVNKLTTTDITDNGDGTYTAQFVILPTLAEDASVLEKTTEKATIIINTTCGHVDITTPDDSGLTLSVDESKIVASAKGTSTLEECFTEILKEAKYGYTENTEAKFVGENTGRVFLRSIVADMNNATLDGSYVYSSDDIIRYVNIYNKMGKENTTNDYEMNLILSSDDAAVTTFADLTKEALAAVDAENNYTEGINKKINVTLSAGNINKVEITDEGEVYDIRSLKNSVALVLGAGEWTMNDVLDLNDNIKKIINNGTLTVNGTKHPTYGYHMSLKEAIHNVGTLKIGGDGILQVPGNLTTAWGSKIKIAAEQNLKFTENITTGLFGTIDVEAASSFLTTEAGNNVTVEGIINNYGTVAAEGGLESNGFINKQKHHVVGNSTVEGGIIYILGEQAITYIHNNATGTINMKTRTDEVVVASADKGAIVYPYTAADGSTFKYTVNDRFTCVKFGKDVTNLTLVKNVEEGEEGYDASLLDIKDLNFIFTGTTSLKAANTDNMEIENLTVNSGANLRVLSGNKLTVNNLVNGGVITIGGYIYYKNSYDVKGTVYSQGGAILYAPNEVADIDALKNAISANEGIVLSESIDLKSDYLSIPANYNGTIDLNGNTLIGKIINSAKMLKMKNGTVTTEEEYAITNRGTLELNDVSVSAKAVAVYSKGTIGEGNSTANGWFNLVNPNNPSATVKIEGGTFTANGNSGNQYAIYVVDNTKLEVKSAIIDAQRGGVNVNCAMAKLENCMVNGGSLYGLYAHASYIELKNCNMSGLNGYYVEYDDGTALNNSEVTINGTKTIVNSANLIFKN